VRRLSVAPWPGPYWEMFTFCNLPKPPRSFFVRSPTLEEHMRTIAQKRKAAARKKAFLVIVLAATIFTPKLDGFDAASIPFPLVTTAMAAASDRDDVSRP
jgi:hypothetical protein